MPKFLTKDEIYRLLQRELPEGVYIDGPATAGFSTAENDSVAKTLESVYTNLERIYLNQFPQYADERIDDWEIMVFGELSEAGLLLQDRRDRVLRRIRRRISLKVWDLLTIVAEYLPEGTYVQIIEWSCGDGANWQLGVSQLGYNTNLGMGDPSLLGDLGSDPCHELLDQGWQLGISKLGDDAVLGGKYSWQLVSEVQRNAYTYEVRIFDYEVTGTDLTRLLRDLRRFGRGTAGKRIRQNLDLADFFLTEDAGDVDQFDLVNCIARDGGSSTGYNGRQRP